MTALHLGVSGGHVDTVKELAENADPSALDAIDGVSVKTTIPPDRPPPPKNIH